MSDSADSAVDTREGTRPGARWWVPERPEVETLRSAVQGCQGCELYADATQAVMGTGPPDAELMVVGEQPGDQEDRQGEPFVGPAGRLLDRALEEAGIDPASVWRTNVVKHFRFGETRGKQRIHKSPSQVHVAACGPWLVAELDVVRPTGVVTLGATAGRALWGSGFRVGDARGQVRPWPDAGLGSGPAPQHVPVWALATTHPAAVLRSRNRAEDEARLVADLALAARTLRQ